MHLFLLEEILRLCHFRTSIEYSSITFVFLCLISLLTFPSLLKLSYQAICVEKESNIWISVGLVLAITWLTLSYSIHWYFGYVFAPSQGGRCIRDILAYILSWLFPGFHEVLLACFLYQVSTVSYLRTKGTSGCPHKKIKIPTQALSFSK